MTTLVTGGAGFIGYHLTDKLLNDGETVIVIDNLSDYYDVSLKHARLKLLQEKENFQFHKLDILEYEKMEELAKKHKIDRIVHLAALAGVRYSLDHGIEYVRTNYEGTYNIFELARHYKIPKVVYASSSAIYGSNQKMPSSESDFTDTPITLYGATKKADELLAHTFSHLFGVNSVGLRFFNVYGSWGRPDSAIFIFTDRTFRGQALDVFNHGNTVKDFTYVGDIVDGIIRAAGHDTKFDVFNLGSGKQVHLMDYIKAIEKEVGKESDKKMLPKQMGDVTQSLADISKARSKLGYEPKVFVEQGIGIFVDWYRDYYNA